VKSGFLDKLIDRLDRLDPKSLQTQFLHLVQERGLMETIFQSLQEGVLVIDARGRLTYANRAAHEMFGLDFERHAMIGIPVRDLWPQDDEEQMEWVLGQGLAGGWSGDVKNRHADGSLFDASATVFAIGGTDGFPVRVVGIIRDASCRRSWVTSRRMMTAPFSFCCAAEASGTM